MSNDYKYFLSNLLAYDCGERQSAHEALCHPWLSKVLESVINKKLTKVDHIKRNKTNKTNRSDKTFTSKFNIELLQCLVSVARGTDKKYIKNKSKSTTKITDY